MKFAAVLIAAMAIIGLAPSNAAEAAKPGSKAKSQYSLKGVSTLPPRRRAYKNLRQSHTLESKKFYDPALGPRAQGEPFDNGFFFEQPSGPYGGTTPYMH